MRRGIEQATTVIYSASPDAADSEYVGHELAIARDEGKTILPFWIRGEKWSRCTPMGYYYAQHVDGRDAAYAVGLAALLAALGAISTAQPTMREAPQPIAPAIPNATAQRRSIDFSRFTTLVTLSGHTNIVFSVAWSPDGARLATASWDNTARIWNSASGRLLTTLSGHSNYVQFVAWSPDGARLATASKDQMARVWDAVSGRLLTTFSGHTEIVWSVAWSPDGAWLATASNDQTARVRDAASGRLLTALSGHTNSVYSAAWSPDGVRLATASNDKTAWVWGEK